MTMTWENNLDLDGILERVRANTEDALGDGAQIILDRSDELVPNVSGDLAATGAVKKDRGGLNTVAIIYTSVYARWIEDHLSFAHPHGGGARFLELAMIEKGPAAVNKAGESLWGRL